MFSRYSKCATFVKIYHYEFLMFDRFVVMHTSYQPLKPATNKLLKKRWDGAAQDMHRKKVSGAKPVVDTKSPATYTHLQYKMKKMQVDLF